jgi:hypothetical protein
MPNKKPVIISTILTILILVILAIISVLLQLVATSGANQSQGLTAVGISLACQGVVIILLGIFAARSTNFLITKVQWDSILAVVTIVLLATTMGGVISFLSSIIAIPLAGIR